MLAGLDRDRGVARFATTMVMALVCGAVASWAWSVDAAPGDADSTFVPTAGCRLVDTRPAPNNVGLKSSPLGPGEIFEVVVHGSNGDCTGALAVPSDAVAVALNVTALNATATSNVRLYPANLTAVPLVSNLNVTAGAPPTPNKVDVKLSPDGRLRVFNEFGTVNVIADVVGYYTDASLQELSQRVAALEAEQADVSARIGALEAATATLDAAQPFAVTDRDSDEGVTAVDEVVVSVEVTAPVTGQVTVSSTTTATEETAGDAVRCSVNTGTALDLDHLLQWESPGDPGFYAQLAGTRVFDIAAGDTATYHLVCDHVGTSGTTFLFDSVLTAIFTPAP